MKNDIPAFDFDSTIAGHLGLPSLVLVGTALRAFARDARRITPSADPTYELCTLIGLHAPLGEKKLGVTPILYMGRKRIRFRPDSVFSQNRRYANAAMGYVSELSMEKKSEPEIGLDRMGEPIIDPAPDRPHDMEDSPASNAMAKGAKWGALVGVLIAQWYMRQHSPLGFYTGSELVVFAVCIGICGFAGAATAWLNYLITRGRCRLSA